jgi:phosphatidylglycerophosphate synthase
MAGSKQGGKGHAESRPVKAAEADPIKHKRTNNTILSFLERPALAWLCERMPSWVTPDLLTALGVFGAIVVAAGYVLARYHPAFIWLASLGILLHWLGDSLDGSLARYRHIERPKYGFFIDHTIDVISELLIILGIGLSGYVDFTLALLFVIAFFMMSIFVFIYTFVSSEFRISYVGVGPTEMRGILLVVNVLIFFIGKPVVELGFMRFKLYDGIAATLVLLLFVVYVWFMIAKAIELNRLESRTGREGKRV